MIYFRNIVFKKLSVKQLHDLIENTASTCNKQGYCTHMYLYTAHAYGTVTGEMWYFRYIYQI